MRIYYILIFVLQFNFLHSQIDPKSRSIDSISKFKVVKLKNSRGVILPSIYLRDNIFNETKTDSLKGFFTPDEKTIKEIDEVLPKLYYPVIQKFNDQWNFINDDMHQKMFAEERRNTKKEAKKITYYDKQFYGYINSKNEKIVQILLFNFKQDPLNLKYEIEHRLIKGWHGWFETNTRSLKYHVESKIFTVNDDL